MTSKRGSRDAVRMETWFDFQERLAGCSKEPVKVETDCQIISGGGPTTIHSYVIVEGEETNRHINTLKNP